MFLREHGRAIDADLARYYGLGLYALGTRRLTWGRLLSLLRFWPPESALARQLHGEAAEWGSTEHLLAAVVDLLAEANWQRAGNKKVAPPKPIERPHERQARKDSRSKIEAKLLQQRDKYRGG